MLYAAHLHREEDFGLGERHVRASRDERVFSRPRGSGPSLPGPGDTVAASQRVAGFENRPIVHYPQAYSLDAIRHDIEDRYDILLMIANPSGAFGLTGIDQFCRKRRGRNQIK